MSKVQTSPYLGLPSPAWWKRSVSSRPSASINPHLASDFSIAGSDRIASAGSCFAQRISEALQALGYAYLVAEGGPPFLSAQ